MIWMDCKLAVEGWQAEDERPTALEDMLSGDDDDAELLTDEDISNTSQQPQEQGEEFNEKWTYVASLEDHTGQATYGQEEPPPAYTPGSVQVSEDEKAQASTSNTFDPIPVLDIDNAGQKHYQAIDYRELYDQITQREKNAAQPRPYAEFQQRLQKHGCSAKSVSPRNSSQNPA
ncbi:hypothetical protein BJV82DRAFT_598419 [Fennellomyces sp. T-0311]|nr:hypothetical protein BJV82DRAFT_598419 [Fennellomyces sp. T-0311]